MAPTKDPVLDAISKIGNQRIKNDFAPRAKAANAPAGMGTPANLETLKKVYGIAPDLATLLQLMTVVYYHRSLTDLERSRVIVTALIVQGAAPEELYVHGHTFLNNGGKPRELVALALSCTLYTGFPRAINGLKTIQEVLESRGQEAEARAGATGFLGQLPGEEGLDPLVALMKRGAAKTGKLKEAGAESKKGVGYADLGDVMKAGPDLSALLMAGFGTHYLIPGITDVERAVTVVTSLMTLGTAPEELEIHSHTALNLGLTPEKLVGITYNLVSYIGFPRVIGALRTVAKVLKERDLLDKMQATLPKL